MKKICFYAIMILMIALVIETMAQLTYWVIYKQHYSPNNFRATVAEKNQRLDPMADFLQMEVVHPYIGYVFDFGDAEKNRFTYGFNTKNTPQTKREAGKVNVVILGGSVADALSRHIGPFLAKVFKEPPRVINLAMGGAKEPQQLFALGYFLSLGAEYDVVINVDGFNEMVLPYVENYTAGINPFFPRSWKLRFTRKYDMGEIGLIGKIKYLRELRQEALAGVNGGFFQKSAVYGLLKAYELGRLHNLIYKNTIALAISQRKAANRFEESGPFNTYNNPEELYQECAAVWEKCSLLMNAMCQQNGIEYYHFLQPNQYYENSKRLTAEEMRIAFNLQQPYRPPVVKGYPLLVARGNDLVENKVKYFDATMVFSKITESIYNDDCCHFNQEGIELFADFIAQKVRESTRLQVN